MYKSVSILFFYIYYVSISEIKKWTANKMVERYRVAKNSPPRKNSIRCCNSYEKEETRGEMTEIFISSRLLSLFYKSHARLRGENTQNSVVVFDENRLGQRASVCKTRDFIGKHYGNIDYPFSALSPTLHTSAVRFFYISRERNISRRLFPPIASRIFTGGRGKTAINENALSFENFQTEVVDREY